MQYSALNFVLLPQNTKTEIQQYLNLKCVLWKNF